MKIQDENFWQHHAKALRAAGLEKTKIDEVIKEVKSRFKKVSLKNEEVIKEIARYVAMNMSPSEAENYRFWIRVYLNHIPIVILLMGVTGTGKTKIAYKLTERLEDVTYVPTDLIREILRSYLPKLKYPFLWKSSYNAWEAFEKPIMSGHNLPDNKLVIKGYIAQNQLLFPALNSIVRWACKTGRIVILEGINIDCNTVVSLEKEVAHVLKKKQECIFPFLITIKDEKIHKLFLKYRSKRPVRPIPFSRYKKYYPCIRVIQDFLVSEATKHNILILDGTKKTVELVNEIIGTIVKIGDRGEVDEK